MLDEDLTETPSCISQRKFSTEIMRVEVFSQPNVQGQRLGSVRASIDMEIGTWELPLPQNAPLCLGVTGGETRKSKSYKIIYSARI